MTWNIDYNQVIAWSFIFIAGTAALIIGMKDADKTQKIKNKKQKNHQKPEIHHDVRVGAGVREEVAHMLENMKEQDHVPIHKVIKQIEEVVE